MVNPRYQTYGAYIISTVASILFAIYFSYPIKYTRACLFVCLLAFFNLFLFFLFVLVVLIFYSAVSNIQHCMCDIYITLVFDRWLGWAVPPIYMPIYMSAFIDVLIEYIWISQILYCTRSYGKGYHRFVNRDFVLYWHPNLCVIAWRGFPSYALRRE